MQRAQANAVRLALLAFVLAWLLGPSFLRDAVPLLLVFLVALGLEVHFFVTGYRAGPPALPDRAPQEVDRALLGFDGGTGGYVLVHDEDGEELWVPDTAESPEELEELVAAARERRLEEDEARAWASRRRRPPLRGLLGAVAVVAALAATIWVVQGRTGWNGLDADERAEATARFSSEASHVAAKPVEIRCDEAGEHVGAVQHADGVAVVGGELAWLTPQRCFDLYRLAFRGEDSGSQTARALAVLAHEAWHLRGERDEGVTECYALQSAVGIGERLGLSTRRARQLMRQQLGENALRGSSAPQYLVPAGCRDGGSLDLEPERPGFP